MELVWEDYCEKLTDQALNPLNSYGSQFPELKAKIAKRGRKMVDYDGARHNFDTLRANSKKPDEAKVQKVNTPFYVLSVLIVAKGGLAGIVEWDIFRLRNN